MNHIQNNNNNKKNSYIKINNKSNIDLSVVQISNNWISKKIKY